MAFVDVDVSIHIVNVAAELNIGQSSIFTTTSHPGTNKTIAGWKWDERTWSNENELEASVFIPTVWDPFLSTISNEDFQSGYGDNDDLLLLGLEELAVSGQNIWTAKIHTGYFYIGQEEHYLFSDQHMTEYVSLDNVVSGVQYHDLQYSPEPGMPIQVRNYTFDTDNSKYEVDTNVRKKVAFSGGDDPEFTIDTSFSPPRLVFSEVLNTTIGGAVSGVDSNTDVDDILALEHLGYSNNEASQEWFLEYSPIDRSQPIEIWTWSSPSAGHPWTIISGQDTFTAGNNREVYVDYDFGIIKFGNYDISTGEGNGSIPKNAASIGVYYTKGIEVKYEPAGAIEYIYPLGSNIDLNPVRSSIQNGFLQISTTLQDPASITLSSTLVQSDQYLISLGNITGELYAQVLSSDDAEIDGQSVFFEILDPPLGTFGGISTETTAITANGGIAKTLYHSPATVSELGRGAGADEVNVVVGGGTTTIDFNGLADTDNVSGVYLYKVHTYDEVLGIAASTIESYYSNFLSEEDITSGVQATQDFETEYRATNSLYTPATYSSTDLTTGKKTLIMTTQANGVMDTHSGIESSSTYIPLFPISTSGIGTDTAPILQVTYDTELEMPDVGDTRGYFGVSDAICSVRAYVVHPRTANKIYSNTINIKVSIPDTVNGTFFAETLNDISAGLLTKVSDVSGLSTSSINATSGVDGMYDEYLTDKLLNETYEDWFKRTRVGDTAGLTVLAEALSDDTLSGLYDVEAQTPTTNAIIPLGFRLKSTGLTLASILDQITYLDPNDTLASGVFEVDY